MTRFFSNRLFRRVLVGAIAAVPVALAQSLAAEPTGHPHVVVILVDDLGYGDAGCFNDQSKIATPTLDQIASEGMRLTDAHAPGPLCHMSRYGLMTGRYPFRVDVNRWPEHALIRPGETTLASHLKSAGYHTAMIGKWHLGFEENGYDQPLPGGPVDVGFDEFFGIRASTDIPPYFYIRGDRAVTPPTAKIAANQTDGWSPIQGAFWRAGNIDPDLDLADVLPRLTDEAIAVIDEHGKRLQTGYQPLMLYVALPAPHTPWLPSELYEKASKAGLYGDFVMMVDAAIGRIVDRLGDRFMDRDTLLIITSDNGPVWVDADVERFGHDSAGPWRGMKADAWEAGHRMPMWVRWPNKVAAGSTSDQLVCFTDLLATFAEITDKPLPPDAGPDSISFLPMLLNRRDENAPARTQWVMKSGAGHFVVRDQNWKWIDGLGSGGFSKPSRMAAQPGQPTSQLYDLSTDSGEQHNLAGEYPERVEAMRQILVREQNAGSASPPARTR